MKLTLVLTFLVMSFNVLAQETPGFEVRKQKMLESIEKQGVALQALKVCVEAAKDTEGTKKCHEAAKAEREKMQVERMKNHIKQIEEKKK